MKNIGCLILATYLTFGNISFSQPLDLLKRQCTFEDLKGKIISQEAWHPFPTIIEREKWENLPEDVKIQAIKSGEEFLDFKWMSVTATSSLRFIRDGNRTEYDSTAQVKRIALEKLTLAECIENKGRFMDQIVNGIWSICENSYWGSSAHLYASEAGAGLPDIEKPYAGLITAMTSSLMSYTLYLLGPKLDEISPQIRKRVANEIKHRFLEPALENTYAWHRTIGNHNTSTCSDWLTSVLIIEDNPDLRARSIWRIIESTDIFLNSYPSDGGCDEGPGYWELAGAKLFTILELLNLATNGTYNKLWDQDIIKNIGLFPYNARINFTWNINFSDADPRSPLQGDVVWLYGDRIKNKLMKQVGAFYVKSKRVPDIGIGTTNSLLSLFSMNEILRTLSRFSLPLDTWLPALQIMIARGDSTGTQGWTLVTKGGNNGEGHNHNDVGSYIIYHNGQPVIIDIGAGTYTAKTFVASTRYTLWFNNSAYHNLPLINNVQQSSGKSFCATNVKYSKSNDLSSLSLSIKTAYPKEANIQELNRTCQLLRHKGVQVNDTYKFKSPSNFKEILMTTHKVFVENPGKLILESSGESERILLYYDKNDTRVTIEKMPLDQPEDVNVKQNWGPNIYRIIIERSGTSQGNMNLKFLLE